MCTLENCYLGVMVLKREKVLSFLNFIVTMLLTIVFIFTVLLVINSKTSGENTTIFGYQIKSVLSGSMEPDIQTGSIIFVKTGGDMSRFETGDVITFFVEENMLITHRVETVESDGQMYITKGDANNGTDIEPVHAENIVGEYTGVTIPYAGYVLNFANTKEGAALLLILPGVLLLFYGLISIWRTARKFDYKKKEMKSEAD